MIEQMPERLLQALAELIDTSKAEIFLSKAPGRIEVLGNHTDYNAGMVLSATIDKYVWSVGAASENIIINALDYDEVKSFDPTDVVLEIEDRWLKYAKGVFWAFTRRGHRIRNITAVVQGNVPLGGGLSSSAALEVSLVNLIKEISGLTLNPKAAAMLAFEAERLFCGISCGVMDQFTSQLGRPKSLLGINCMNLQTEDIPFDSNASFVIIDSMVAREASDALNKRRLECVDALDILQKAGWEIENLSYITPSLIDRLSEHLDDTMTRRVTHIVLENERVRNGIVALKESDLKLFGGIMLASHASSRDLYEVSHPNLDRLVRLSEEQEGVLGSRLSGAGFGGNVIALVKQRSLDRFKNEVSKEYEGETGKRPHITEVSIPGGVQTRRL